MTSKYRFHRSAKSAQYASMSDSSEAGMRQCWQEQRKKFSGEFE